MARSPCLFFTIFILKIHGLFKKYREFWISTGYVYSIFDFFVALCWYSYSSLMPTSSVILNVRLIFDSYFVWTCFGSSSIFASSVSGTKKSYREADLGNTVIAAKLLCCFWSKIRAQATMCKQGRYHGAKAKFCSFTNPGVSYRFFDPFFGIGKNWRRAKTRPSKIAVKN